VGQPETSVVIRTFNEERHLPALLAALDHQAYRDFEIIVVDSGSFDRTRQIAERADQLLSLDPHDFTFGHSLNVGMRAARGRFAAIVSAHTVPVSDDWLGKLVAPLSDDTIALVYGQQRGRAESKFSECRDFERTFGEKPLVLAPPAFFANNANAAVRRDLWLEQPFDETLPGLEDIAWAKHWMQRGYRVLYEPGAAIFHIHDETWPQVRRRFYREGQAAKWLGLRGRRHAGAEVWRETRSLLVDVGAAVRAGCFPSRAGEIVRFRYEKLHGTLQGIWDGAAVENPTRRTKLLFDRHYDAVVIRGPGRAAMERLDLPELRPSEVLIRVAFEGVCATDLEVLGGELGYYKNGMAKYPIVPGHEFSGTVAAAGAKVADLKAGDPVVVECIQGCGRCAACVSDNPIACADRRETGVMNRDGGYAQYVLAQARFVHRIPTTLGLKLASLCEPAAVVIKGLRRLSCAWHGSTTQGCAVVGGGPIGNLAAQMLAHRGYPVTVLDRDPRRLEHFNSSIRVSGDLGGLERFDAIVEATGDPDALETVLHASAAGTTILLLGLPYARREFSFESIVGYDKTVVGSVGSGPRDFEDAICMLPKLDTTAFLRSVVPFADFREAWEIARTPRFLKTILQVDSTMT
jgi:2-desacetyl-2-hydroxyethyl bacteriochlorophyllide A dehydrogenase